LSEFNEPEDSFDDDFWLEKLNLKAPQNRESAKNMRDTIDHLAEEVQNILHYSGF
jgi:hypothetical protein